MSKNRKAKQQPYDGNSRLHFCCGSAAGNRIIDLSQAAAKALEVIESGTASVRLELPSGQ
jgi:hypothetical protein